MFSILLKPKTFYDSYHAYRISNALKWNLISIWSLKIQTFLNPQSEEKIIYRALCWLIRKSFVVLKHQLICGLWKGIDKNVIYDKAMEKSGDNLSLFLSLYGIEKDCRNYDK